MYIMQVNPIRKLYNLGCRNTPKIKMPKILRKNIVLVYPRHCENKYNKTTNKR